MKYLLDNQYAPTTFSWGFIDAPFDRTIDTFVSWSVSIFKHYRIEYEVVRYQGSLTNLLAQLFPVTAPCRREMLTSTASGWTAYFDNFRNGGDPISRVGQMCDMLKCRGVAVTCAPDRHPEWGRGTFGGVQFQLFAPHETDFINHLRHVGVTCDDDGWAFDTNGPVQPFEETLEYSAHRVRDRFTAEMLERYCAALGIDLFNPEFYGPNAVMVVDRSPLSPTSPCLSREEARHALGLD